MDDGAAGPAAWRDFGTRLRELRQERGWSLAELATAASISQPHLRNLERGERSPTPNVARCCDTALRAGGELVTLVPPSVPQTAGVDVDALVTGYSTILSSLRDIGRANGPRPVADPLRASARVLEAAAGRVDGEPARRLWLLAAQFAEYAGWMAQEAGNDVAALRWTRTAVRWAGAGGDASMGAYALVRRALIAQHRGDAAAVVEFARRAGASPAASASVRVFATRREAAGHALLGDYDACMRSLQQSREELARLPEQSFGWGPRAHIETSVLIEASCLLGLGRYQPAARLFQGLDRLPAAAGPAPGTESENSRIRFALRRATALFGCGAVEQACAEVGRLLPAIGRLDSATVRAELAVFQRLVASGTGPADVRETIAATESVLRSHPKTG